MLRSGLKRRRRQPEIMDRADLNQAEHVQALRGLERINRWTNSVRIVWPAIRDLANAEASHPLRLLDVATGGGDAPIRLWHRARRAGLSLEILGCDRSATAIAHADHSAKSHSASVRFFEHDILAGRLPEMYDVVMCSLFMHHLDESNTVRALRTMAQAARKLVLVQDLRRCLTGYWLAYVGSRLLSRSPIVHFDGPVSVEGAYTDGEFHQLADQAGMPGAQVTRHWPCRFLMRWARP